MSAPSPLIEADRNQARASDPFASAWVSANAGTGKTEVLVRRVLRLLLGGAPPECILCLTYTKTAAAEMQNRLLKDLSKWATMPAAELGAKLAALIGREPSDTEMRTARRLFARVIEAKGGLKIHTIHGFCERLLQRFPLEALVTPNFSVLDEREQALLRSAAIDATVARAAREKDSYLGVALATLISATSEFWFRKVIAAILDKRGEIARIMGHHDADDWLEAEACALKQALGVADAVEDALAEELSSILSDAEIEAAITAFASFGGEREIDKKAEESLRKALLSQGTNRIASLREIFFRVDGEARAKLYSREIEQNAPTICALLDHAQARFVALDETLAHLRVAEASAAALAIADAIQADYERRKRSEAALDYDDLIAKSLHLLSRAGAASWVLYKIDGGIEHILVDEAQDTNPDQWRIVEALADEFFAGAGASGTVRTVFAVGDEKQSIYSFQGANPARFGEVGRAFRARAAAIRHDFHPVPLTLSFRSVPVILEAVDRVFEQPAARQGLTFAEASVIKHHAVRENEPGVVEIWDIEREEKRKPVEAFQPWLDEASGARSVEALAKRIAAQIKHWIVTHEYLPSKKRGVRAGDVLILVRRRDPFFAPMIRALKREGVPVAGADRMKLMDQLAVQDLIALAEVLLLPQDDLALAVVLKSPLFGLDDDALFDLAYDRKGSLWAALKDSSREDTRFVEAHQRLTTWLGRVDLLPPYEFFAEILGAEGQMMRERMLVRLGPEAADAIDEFLDLALAHDREAAPSLQGFVNRLCTDEAEIKRDMEQDRNEVRIMTVHGAKGLQAPIVFLPDTCMGAKPQQPRLYSLPRVGDAPGTVGHLVWPPPGHANVEGILGAKADTDRANREEYNRLLYVAMTRACDRLYVCGWTGQRDAEENCWYRLIRNGLAGHLTESTSFDGRPVWRLESGQQETGKEAQPEETKPEPMPLPDWALTPAKPERARRRLTPSRLALSPVAGIEPPFAFQPPLGPLALSANHRFARGRLVHALLQHLPEVAPDTQEQAARIFVTAQGGSLSQDLRDEILAETLAIVRDPRFAPLFRPGSLAEVPVLAKIGDGEDGYELEGQIDRLVVLEQELLILDYKTNRPPPKVVEEVAPAYIDQLAAYRVALKRMFPGRSLRAALLWTDGPNLMEIPSTSLDSAEMGILAPRPKP